MSEPLKIDIDIKKREGGGLDVTSDFSDYIAKVRQEYIESLSAAILDSIEPYLNRLGWCKKEKKEFGVSARLVEGDLDAIEILLFGEYVKYRKELTCHNVSDAGFGFKCSECSDWEDIEHNPYCPHCGAKVVER